MVQSITKKSIITGLTAGTALMAVYFTILTVANSLEHAIWQLKNLWYWMALLVIGFSLQAGLFVYVRNISRTKAAGATQSVAVAGGVSTTSMVACCAHHVTDVIPLLGLSAAAVFLNQFQTLFILVGILSNFIGVTFMLKIIQDYKLYTKEQKIAIIMKLNMRKALRSVIIFSAVVMMAAIVTSL